MSGQTVDRSTLQASLDTFIYTPKRCLMMEKVFGHTFISTGGKETADKYIKQLNLKPGDYVLDVGCGVGGSAFIMDLQYGAKVRGIDLCQHMLDIAHERQKEVGSKNTSFVLEDIMTAKYEENHFDLIYSRDVIVHLEEKEFLYGQFYKWLKPGGTIFITDYTRSQEVTKTFNEHIRDYHYRLVAAKDHEEYMKKCGYVDIKVTDESELFIRTLRREIAELRAGKADFVKEFGEDGYELMMAFWEERLFRAENKYQGWVTVYGRKPAN